MTNIQEPSAIQDDVFERDGSFDGDYDNLSETSVKTHSGAVVLWDMLKVSKLLFYLVLFMLYIYNL